MDRLNKLKEQLDALIAVIPTKTQWNKAVIETYKHVIFMIEEDLRKSYNEIDSKKLLLHLFENGYGASAKAMTLALLDSEKKEYSTPSDSSDFKRCSGLIECIPSLKNDLHKVASISKEWKNIVDNWDYLVSIQDGNMVVFWKELELIKDK